MSNKFRYTTSDSDFESYINEINGEGELIPEGSDINTFNYNNSSYKIHIEKKSEEELAEEAARKKAIEYTKEEMEQIRKETLPGNKWASIFCDVDKEKDEKSRHRPLAEGMRVEGDTFYFRTGVDPFDSGRKLYDRKEVVISHDNAITPLIGCNGSGKSTILQVLHSMIQKSGYPIVYYDNMKDGGHNAIDSVAFEGDFTTTGFLLTASEGEGILHNSTKPIQLTKDLIVGKYTRDEQLQPFVDTDHIFLLFDALDSGFSIDNIVNTKAYFSALIELAKLNNKHVYIIVAANSFEIARNCSCWDVQHSKYVEFGTDYEAYRKFIINSRKRILKQWDNISKKEEKEDGASAGNEE